MVLLFSHLLSRAASFIQFVCSNMCKCAYIAPIWTAWMHATPMSRPIDRSTDRPIVTQRVQCASFYSLLAIHIHIFQSCESHFRRAISHWFRKRFFLKNRTLKTCARACVRTRLRANTFKMWFRCWTNIAFSFSFAIVCQIKNSNGSYWPKNTRKTSKSTW